MGCPNSKTESRESASVRQNSHRGLVVLASVVLSQGGELNAATADDGFPDLELLEFLGSFSTDTGEFIDPSVLLENEFGQLLDLAGGETGNDESDEMETETSDEPTDDL